MALTSKSMPYKSGFGPFAPEIYRAPMSYPFRDGDLDGAGAAVRAIDIIEKQVPGRNDGAVERGVGTTRRLRRRPPAAASWSTSTATR